MAILTVFLALACLFSGWPDVIAQGADKVTLEKLRDNLQSAIELEWATIPPYMNAALSIKDGTNTQVSGLLWSILGDEMHHMALAANMLNAIGGAPVLNDPARAPRYPGPLPAGCLPDLTVTLEKLTRAHTERVFMGIETPECEDSVTKFHDHLSKAASPDLKASNEMSEKVEDTFPGLLAKCDEEGYIPDTIGAIYIHKILCPMLTLEREAQGRHREPSIFTGEAELQVSISPAVFPVNNIGTAIKAIASIISQGEGGDACNPYVDDHFTGSDEKVPCHYFKFAEIVHGKEVEYGGNPCRARDPWCHDYFSPCDGNNCESAITFNGPQVPFNEEDVWPIISNSSTDLYPPGSMARELSDAFNAKYVELMQCLHDAMNGHPEKLKKDSEPQGECIVDMHELRQIGNQLVQTPMYPGGDPNVGPNISPTYEFDYESKGQQQQQQQRIEL